MAPVFQTSRADDGSSGSVDNLYLVGGMLAGDYVVTDSRGNSKGVNMVRFALSPTIRIELLKVDGAVEKVVEKIEPSKEYKGLASKDYKRVSVLCFDVDESLGIHSHFMLRNVTEPLVFKDSAMFFKYEPMEITKGYYLRYWVGGNKSQFALEIKESTPSEK